MTETNLYTCSIAELEGNIVNSDFSQTLSATNQVSAEYDASPETWATALIYENFPMNITAEIDITSKYLNSTVCSSATSYAFTPPCDTSITAHTFSAAIVEG